MNILIIDSDKSLSGILTQYFTEMRHYKVTTITEEQISEHVPISKYDVIFFHCRLYSTCHEWLEKWKEVNGVKIVVLMTASYGFQEMMSKHKYTHLLRLPFYLEKLDDILTKVNL